MVLAAEPGRGLSATIAKRFMTNYGGGIYGYEPLETTVVRRASEAAYGDGSPAGALLPHFDIENSTYVLSFGATKNGTLTAEAVIVFRKDLADQVMHRRKRAGQVSSKMRFLSAQLDAYLANDLWLDNARRANRAAKRLGDGLTNAGVTLAVPVEANLVFPKFQPATTARLRAAGFEFLDWPWLGDDVVRLVCGFSTTDAQVDQLVAAVAR